jgi:MFS family permease
LPSFSSSARTATARRRNPRPLRPLADGLPRPLWFLLAGTFVNRSGGFVLFFLVLYVSERGYSPAAAGAAASVYGAGALAAALAGGQLADRLGRRETIVVSMAGSGAAALALSQARPLALIIVLSALTGFFAELYRPAAAALITDLVEPARRVTAFAAYRLAINAGTAAGPAAAGLLATHSFLAVFIADAAASLAFAGLALTALPATRAQGSSAVPRLTPALRADRAFLLFLLASTLAALVYFQFQTTLPLHVVASGHSSATYGMLISLNGLLILAFELPLAQFTQRLPRATAIAAGYALVGLGFALTGAATSTAALAATVLIWTAGEMVSQPLAAAHVSDIAPPQLRGGYQGAFAFTGGIGLVLAPAIGPATLSAVSPLLWIGCGAVGLAAALLVLQSASAHAASSSPPGTGRMRCQG